MKSTLKLVAVIAFVLALMVVALPARAESGSWVCAVSPGSGPIGTTFGIACTGFSPNTILNVYAVEPDGRASGLNIYGFFPTDIKTDSTGTAGFSFVTEIPGLFSVPTGPYTFVVHEIGLGNTVKAEAHIPITVTAKPEDHIGGTLVATEVSHTNDGTTMSFTGSGYAPFDQVNPWVTSPEATHCSGLGIDQLTLGALGAGGSSLWAGPQTVKADAGGNIAFAMLFRPAACIGTYTVTVRSPGSGIAAEASFPITGLSVTETGGASISVSPSKVVTFGSFLTISGSGFPAQTGVNCWFTRPDGRVLSFINVDTKTDVGGSFGAGAVLDDFPPYTSTDPGVWHVTCATPDRSALAITSFTAVGLISDP